MEAPPGHTWVAERQEEDTMTLSTSARIRAFSIITISVIVMLIFLSSAVQATGAVTETEQYRVQLGDTLWHIAQDHGPKDSDTRRLVAAIEKINSIRGGDLQAGQLIEIPVSPAES